MKKTSRLYLLFPVALVVLFVTWLTWSRIATSEAVISQEQSKSVNDPCWFMALKKGTFTREMLERRTERGIYGYPKEIPLAEAIKVFNEEKQCLSSFAGYPPLTEEELIAAIVSGPDLGKQGGIWLNQKDALWKIASQKIMPKGALLVVDSGPRQLESPIRPAGAVESKGIRITLLLGLDKNNMVDGILKPEQTLVIRKIFSKVEIVR